MKYTYYILLSFIFQLSILAQETTTIIEGQGKSCQEARNDALRNAVNKAAGSVIYSKTEIANDALISDEITMLTSGNILHYDEVKPCSVINGNMMTVTLKVNVSQTELKKFIEGKGKSVSISGELLKQKLEQEVASTKAELDIVKSLLMQLEIFTNDPFDYEISIGQVTIKDGKYCDLPADITIKTNINFYNAYLKLTKEIEKIAINSIDQSFRISTLKQSNYPITINSTIYYLRNKQSCNLIDNFYKRFIPKMDDYKIVDDCLKELYLNNSGKQTLLKVNLFFPQPGYIAKKVSGNFTATIEEVGSLNRINIFASHKLLEYKNGRSLSGELSLMKYSETNPLEFQALKNNLLKSFEELAKDKDDGKIKLNYGISFSKDGINKSSIKDINISQENYQQKLDLGISEIKLNPSKLCGKYTITTDDIKLDFKWETYKSSFAYENGKESIYNSYFNNQNLPYGTYILTIKEKELNNIKYKDIYISNYKTRGPLTAVYSAILPGWGTRKVTYNEKNGKDRFYLVATPLVLSLLSKLISNHYYNEYMNSNSQSGNGYSSNNPYYVAGMDRYYELANNWNKTAIIFGSISASFYLYDIAWVIGKGFKNISNKQSIKRKVNESKLQIQTEHVK